MSTIRQLMEMELQSRKLKRAPRAAVGTSTRLSADAIRNAFVLFDAEDCQYLPVSDLPLLLRAVGIVAEDIDFVSGEKEDHISFQEFRQLVHDMSTPQNSTEEAARVFALMDPQGKGALNLETVREVFSEAGSRLSSAEIEEILKYCDVDGDGAVTQADFIAAMAFISELEN